MLLSAIVTDCLARDPDSFEMEALLALFDEHRGLAEADAESAQAAVGKEPIPDGVSPVELAAWGALARTLINLDEFVTRE